MDAANYAVITVIPCKCCFSKDPVVAERNERWDEIKRRVAAVVGARSSEKNGRSRFEPDGKKSVVTGRKKRVNRLVGGGAAVVTSGGKERHACWQASETTKRRTRSHVGQTV